MEKRAFDRHDIDHMQTYQRRAEDPGEMKSIRLRVARMLRSVDPDQDFFDQRPDLGFSYRDQPAAEQLEVLAEALRSRDLETLYLSPAARRIVHAGETQS